MPGETTPDRQDLTYSAGFGLTYKFSRELWLKGEFSQKWVRSNVAGNDYDDSLVPVRHPAAALKAVPRLHSAPDCIRVAGPITGRGCAAHVFSNPSISARNAGAMSSRSSA